MPFAVLLLLFIFFSATPAFAQSDSVKGDPCAAPADIPVHITPRFDNPTYVFDADLTRIQELSADASHNVHGAHKGLTLGFTHYTPILDFSVPVHGFKFPDGSACAHVTEFDATVGYKDVTVYIPREVPPGTCGFNEVMAHEQKHIQVNRMTLEEFVPLIEARMRDYLRIVGTFQGQDAKEGVAQLKANLQVIMDNMAEQMDAENKRRQQLVDSPEEYRRVSASCNGQLGQAVKQFYNGNGPSR